MNEQNYGCFACIQKDYLSPKDVANITYGPLDTAQAFWDSLDGMGKGALVSSVVLLSIFFATMFLKR